ncbi:MAG: DUF5060 domain-containing protein [Pseudomonadota bacterium]
MATVTGTLQEWHKITLDFRSGDTFTEAPSTFRDTRLDVTFTNQDTGQTIIVPGFFAADGNAANSNATSGNVWRVNFNPPSDGNWTYSASLRTGNDVAASTNPNAGTPAVLNGANGTLTIAETDKTGDDFRAKGMILQDEGSHYLQYQGDGDYFIRGGPGVPENFLATTDFDNTPTGRHDFSTHQSDFNNGDPTWDGGKGKAILGAVNYLAEKGQNTIYVLTNTAGGDGQDVFPWADPDFSKIGKNENLTSAVNDVQGLETADFSVFDVSKLAQWEIVFDHMDAQGIYKNILLQETENDQLLNGGTDISGPLDVERLIYMREMVARFGHNNGLQWNLGEENTNTPAEREAMASYLEAIDPYGHLVVIHSFPGQIDQVYNPLLGYDDFDGTSFQTTAQNIRSEIIEFRDKSAANGDPWVLAWDEDSSGNAIIDPGSNNPDSTNEKALREGLWGSLTAGGSGANWYLKGSSGHSFDQNIDDFKGFSSLWEWTEAATSFFNTYIPFWEMTQDDGATLNNNDYVMSKDGEYYISYLGYGEAGDVRFDLRDHGGETFDVFWYDPRNGGEPIPDGTVAGGSVQQVGGPPKAAGKDWVVFLRNSDLPDRPELTAPDPGPGSIQAPPTSGAYEAIANGSGIRFKIQVEDANGKNAGTNPGGDWTYASGPDAGGNQAGAQGTGYYYFGDPQSISNNRSVPDNSILEYTIVIPEGEAGYYNFRAASSRDPGGPGDRRNDMWVRIDDDAEAVQRATTDSVSSKGFVKIFGARDTDWGYSQNIDSVSHDEPNTRAEFFLSEGEHTISLAGRSEGYHVDYFELYTGPAPNSSASDSPFVGGSTPPPPPSPPQTGSISGRYTIDTDGNEIGAGDPGVSGARVTLIQNGSAVASTTTATDGSYAFTEVAPGSYRVRFDKDPDGRAFILGDGNGPATDSDVVSIGSSGNGRTAVFDVTAGGTVANVDAGLVAAQDDPDPEPQPDPGFKIYLINADTNTRLDEVKAGDPVYLPDGDTGAYSFEVVPNDGFSGSVRMSLNGGPAQVENIAPYALFGDMNGNFDPGPVPLGPLNLSVELFEGSNATGTKIAEATVAATTTDTPPQSPPDPVPSPAPPAPSPGANDDIVGTPDNDDLTGTPDDDIIRALLGDDTVSALRGADKIYGAKGADALEGNQGRDAIRGAGGSDTLEGNGGRDKLHGGTGKDMLIGGWADDILSGGKGRDTFYFKGRTGTDTITDFELGRDIIKIGGKDIGFADLDIQQQGDDTLITVNDIGIVLEGIDSSQIARGDFMM